MAKYIIIADNKLDIVPSDPDVLFIDAIDFIANKTRIDLRKKRGAKVINFCKSFDYLANGYYCSLIAEARGMRCVPSVANIITLNWKRHYQNNLEELNSVLRKTYREKPTEPLKRTFAIYFGRCAEEKLDKLSRSVFDLYRFPMMSITIALDAKNQWEITDISPMAIANIPSFNTEFFVQSLNRFTGSAWRTKEGSKERYWIGILHNPKEIQPPSNKLALQKFIKAGKALNVAVELITKSDFSAMLEYDAILIRETTAINHHTYRFALKAEMEDIPCIDDTQSIIRCCNKVFQYEILSANGVPLPKSHIVARNNIETIIDDLSFPVVVKIPDGSFSHGMMKVDNEKSFRIAATELLKKSTVILAQEFISSDYDWRIGVLDGKPLFACKYYMAAGHWQIYNHSARTVNMKVGNSESLSIHDVPASVMSMALKAANLIGDGLYGVDLKQTTNGAVVIEVNDNPNIDAGIEDKYLGDQIYLSVIQSLINRIEA